MSQAVIPYVAFFYHHLGFLWVSWENTWFKNFYRKEISLISFRPRKCWIQLCYSLRIHSDFGSIEPKKDREVGKDENSCPCVVFRDRFVNLSPSAGYLTPFFFREQTIDFWKWWVSGCSMYTDQHLSSGSKQQLIFISTVNLMYRTCVRCVSHEFRPTCNNGLCEKRTWTTIFREEPDIRISHSVNCLEELQR